MTGHSIHLKLDGRTYSGTFTVDRKVVTVTTSFGKKASQVGHHVAQEALAKQLLQEIVLEEKSRKGSTI
jgi:hypothetical protein